MAEAVDYYHATASWRLMTTRLRDGSTTEQWQATLRLKEQVGEREDGTPSFRYRRITRLFPPEVNTETKRKRALREWRKELAEREEVAQAKRDEERHAKEFANTAAAKHIADYAEDYVKTLSKQDRIQRSTASTYTVMINRLKRELPIAIGELTTDDIQKWLDGMADEGLAPRTRLKLWRFVNHVCKHAVNSEHIARNPCAAVLRPPQGDPDPNALTNESATRLVRTLEESEPSSVIVAATLALFAGLREGECCGLRWRDYNEESRTISVREAIGRDGGKNYSKVPKTARSKRTIKVTPPLARMLARRRRYMQEELETTGLTLDRDEFGELYVIGYINGQFYSPSLISRGWKELAESWGLMGTKGRKVTLHDLRHSAATIAVSAGTPIGEVSKMLGHARTSTTVDYYVGSQEEAAESAVTSIANAIDSQGDAPELTVTIPAELAPALMGLLKQLAESSRQIEAGYSR